MHPCKSIISPNYMPYTLLIWHPRSQTPTFETSNRERQVSPKSNPNMYTHTHRVQEVRPLHYHAAQCKATLRYATNPYSGPASSPPSRCVPTLCSYSSEPEMHHWTHVPCPDFAITIPKPIPIPRLELRRALFTTFMLGDLECMI